jgi:hypothetical protein
MEAQTDNQLHKHVEFENKSFGEFLLRTNV